MTSQDRKERNIDRWQRAEKLIKKEKDKNNWEIGREIERYVMRLRG